MHGELAAEGLPTPIQILGVNGVGYEAGNATITAGRVLPWLQDTVDVDAWGLWGVTYRDVVILDENNVPLESFNLTTHDLADPANYSLLASKLRDAAM